MMSIDDYVLSLDWSLFGVDYYAFWVTTILELMETPGRDTDEDLDRLKGILQEYYNGRSTPDDVKGMPHEIVRLRGPGFWRDNSVLGLKYRCLNAIGSTIEENNRDVDNWVYGIVTALQLINLDRQDDEMLIRSVQDGLLKFNSERGKAMAGP